MRLKMSLTLSFIFLLQSRRMTASPLPAPSLSHIQAKLGAQ
jgi:hypothetical protein